MTAEIRRMLDRRRYRREGGALILRYHRIADLPSDPHATAVSPRHFAQHLDVIQRQSDPVHLDTFVQALGKGQSLGRGIAITFDDGYADTLTAAVPRLEHYEVPATVYVTTGTVDRPHEFWWDALERVLLQPGTLPPVLELVIEGRKHSWPLGPGAEYGPEDFERHRGWNWRARSTPTIRHRLFRALFEKLQPLEDEARRPVMRQLSAWAGIPAGMRPTHRTMSTEEMAALARHPLIQLGAHSVTHPLLSELPETRQREEIEESKAFLERLVGSPVSSFAYPYGVVGGASSVVRAAGFESATTTDPGLVLSGTDPFTLPRFYVGDWDGDTFARRIGRWT